MADVAGDADHHTVALGIATEAEADQVALEGQRVGGVANLRDLAHGWPPFSFRCRSTACSARWLIPFDPMCAPSVSHGNGRLEKTMSSQEDRDVTSHGTTDEYAPQHVLSESA